MESIDEYISQFPKDVQKKLKELRRLIIEKAPESEETINYGIPTFKLNGNLVHFAGFKNHIGFYPTPNGIQAFKDKLTNYEISKGTIKIPLTEPIPFDLIREIVEFRVKVNQNK